MSKTTTQATAALLSSKRLQILQQSLAKKEAEFDRRLREHFADVRSANGQPLNDKANGSATVGRWDKQARAMRTLKAEIEKTKNAIDREENTLADVEGTDIPAALREAVAAGELIQWRKHPNSFFVPGVERGRIVWEMRRKFLGHRYLSEVPADQQEKFLAIFRKLCTALKDREAAGS